MHNGTIRFLRAVAAGGVLISVLAGCAEQSPAPVVMYGGTGGADSAGVHTVASGETLSAVARQYHVSNQDIISVNNLKAPYGLLAGQRLMLPMPHDYTAKSGDTLVTIAHMFDVEPAQLAQMNGMKVSSAVTPGEHFKLPASLRPHAQPPLPAPQTPFSVADAQVKHFALYDDGRETAAAMPPPAAHDGVPIGAAHTAYSVASAQPIGAQTAGVSVSSPAITAQPLNAPGWVSASASTSVSAPSGIQAETLAPIATAQQPVKSEPLAQPVHEAALSPAATPGPGFMDDVASESNKAFTGNSGGGKSEHLASLLSGTSPSAGAHFGWPVDGPVISAYGDKPGGVHNDGINIRASKGTPVRAADNGVVVYAGNQLKGFGNLVLIRHADRWMTAYAHLETIDAKRGEAVHKGEAIGKVGSTGDAGTPQLHFEIRRGTEALNPQAFMGPRGT